MRVEVNEDNPMVAVDQLLSLAGIQVLRMREAIKLMDVPMQHWKIRKLAMSHCDVLEAEIKDRLQRHTEIRAELKRIGY